MSGSLTDVNRLAIRMSNRRLSPSDSTTRTADVWYGPLPCFPQTMAVTSGSQERLRIQPKALMIGVYVIHTRSLARYQSLGNEYVLLSSRDSCQLGSWSDFSDLRKEDTPLYETILQRGFEESDDWDWADTVCAATVGGGLIGSQLQETITPECIEFCKAHGILVQFNNCLDKAVALFSNVVSVSADYDRFPPDECEDEGHVAIGIEVRSDQDTAFRDYERYGDWMLDNIAPAASRFFVVTFNRV